MPDVGGLAIWHIMEDPVVYGSLPPPPGVTSQQWAKIATDDAGAKRFECCCPMLPPPFDETIALRDGADPVTGFDVVSDDPNPQHSSLKWADGTPSGFAIRNISAPDNWTADIEIPW